MLFQLGLQVVILRVEVRNNLRCCCAFAQSVLQLTPRLLKTLAQLVVVKHLRVPLLLQKLERGRERHRKSLLLLLRHL